MKSGKDYFFALVILFSINTYSQQASDSTVKYIINWQITTGASQMNFSGLHKYQYLLNSPSNYSFRYLSPALLLGTPKFFVSAYIGVDIGENPKGTFDGYNISAGGSSSFFGANVNFPLRKYHAKKIIRSIYISAGMQYCSEVIYSKASGIGALRPNRDTTFYYENSKAKNILANVEVMFELFNLTKQTANVRIPLVFKLGYNFQFQKPQWSGIYSRNAGDANPNINLGGFYVVVGFNVWSSKDFWKRTKK